MKKTICLVLSAAVLTTLFYGCSKSKSLSEGGDYLKRVSAYSFWENDLDTSVAQYNVYNHVTSFLEDGNIVDGNVVSDNGKTKKVLFLGFDGARADALTNIIHDENEFETNGYNAAAPYSGIRTAAAEGGVYLAYCGGEKDKDNQQSTSTSASWTSQFTGVWGENHGVRENEDTKNLDYKTFMLSYAENGLKTSIAFDWGQYFDTNLKSEIEYVMANPQIDMTFCDIDREKVDKLPKDALTDSLDLYNFSAAGAPSKKAPYDEGMRDYILNRIDGGDDIVCGIFHNIDSNGHTYAFSNSDNRYVDSVRTCDAYAYEITQIIKEREKEFNEEWLIVFSNDHGGIGQSHGGQSAEERTTWIVSNRKLDTKYYANGYNGFKVK